MFSLLKKFKKIPRDIISPINQEDTCDYNPWYFMCSKLNIKVIIVSLFIDITKQTTDSEKKYLFSKIQDDTNCLYKVSL